MQNSINQLKQPQVKQPQQKNFQQQKLSLRSYIANNYKNIQSKLLDLLQFLQVNYPYPTTKINLSSQYQIAIGPAGVDIVTRYFSWSIQTLNLIMHKIQNQGVQHIIKRNLSEQSSRQKWNTLTQLALIKNNLTDEAFQGIQKVDFKNISILRIRNNFLTANTIKKFISCDWQNFKQLYLSNNKISKEGCKLLMKSKWKFFQKIDLNYNLIQNQGAHYLSQADWPNLLQINLSNNKLDARTTFYLKQANWPLLKTMILNKNQIGKKNGKLTNVGCINLCSMKSQNISHISIFGNDITLNGVSIIIKCQNFKPECFLQLSRNWFKFQEIAEMIKLYNKFCNQFDTDQKFVYD